MCVFYRFVCLALLLLFTGLSLTGCDDSKPLALGTLERDRVTLKATASEIITAQPVAEGSQVVAGTVVVKLDNRRQQGVVDRARAQLQAAQARWDELRNGARNEDVQAARAELQGARAALEASSKALARARTLRPQGVNTQADLDAALAARDSAQAQVRATGEKLRALTNGTRPEVLAQAKANIKAAKATLTLAQLGLSELSIRATRSGYLDSLPWHVGERVSAGTPVAVILAAGAPYARVYIPEPQRAQISVGDTLTVRADGVPRHYRGVVRWIARDPAFSPYYALNASDRSRLVYLAKIAIHNGEKLPTGLPVEVYRHGE